MPIPKPNAGEKQSDFISRCMGNDTMKSEYPDQKQRAAICHTSWRENRVNMKLETVDIDKPIEIFQTGNWKGFEFKTSDLDEAIKHFDDGLLEPYLTLDHNPGLTKTTQDFFKAMSLGFVSKLWRQGEKLMANFKQVPKLMAELIDSGAFKKRSVEWLLRLKHANGKVYKNILEFVTFHGGNGFPALNTLADIPKLFKDCDSSEYEKTSTEQDAERVSIPFNLKQEVKPMGNELGSNEVAVPKQEYNDLLKAKATLDKLTMDIEAKDAEIATFKTSVSEKDEQIAKVQLKSDEADKKLEEVNKRDAEFMKNKATEYIDARIEAKQELPKYRDMKIADYIRIAKTGDDEALKLFKSELEDRDPLVFKSISKENGTDESDEGNIRMDYKSEKEAFEKEEDDMDKMDAEIKVVMKRDKCDYTTAAKKLGYSRGSGESNEGGDA